MYQNPILLTDFYKVTHPFQYPDHTTLIYSNLTPRKSRVKGVDEVVFFGLQYVMIEFLVDRFNEDFFKQPLGRVMADYKRRITTSIGGIPSYEHVEALHKLGYLPVEIRALPEGSRVPIRVPMFTIHNTLPQFYWVTNFLETIISNAIWQPITSATLAGEYRKILDKWAIKTGMPKEFVNFQAHDFSMRGMGGLDASITSGMGHLLFFTGTDTIPAIEALEYYYNADAEKDLIGASIPATEHSVMCAGGFDGELETYRRLIQKVYPDGLVGIVSDTWDLWKVLTNYNVIIKETIMARNGKVVFRPDSGDPVDIICGAEFWPEQVEKVESESIGKRKEGDWTIVGKNEYIVVNGKWKLHPKHKGVVELLWDVFGGTVNEQGYKVLDSHVGVIYGDSITLERAEEICQRLADKGFASQAVLGVGSYTYQYNTRDTFGMAIKATYSESTEYADNTLIGGTGFTETTVSHELFKDPITDDGTKKSAKGLIKIVKDENGKFKMLDQQTWDDVYSTDNEMKLVFKNGIAFLDTLARIRERVAK